jgi:hypothetical protein
MALAVLAKERKVDFARPAGRKYASSVNASLRHMMRRTDGKTRGIRAMYEGSGGDEERLSTIRSRVACPWISQKNHSCSGYCPDLRSAGFSLSLLRYS